ncbi:MAG: C2 family cysteine protease, partial [Clostridia bacterium]|nr:C2 family cysteine protease [Clostridia bacterium]
VGDCYLMAALISLAKKNPQAIVNCFTQGVKNVENEDDIDIRFFHLKENKAVPIVITVNKRKIIDPTGMKNNALWPKLIEKAYAVYRKREYERILKYEGKKLDGGFFEIVLFAITGKSPKVFDNEKDVDKIVSKINSILESSRALGCGFKENFEIKDMKTREKITIYRGHAYAIVGIGEKNSKKYIRLINPYKDDGRKPENNLKSKEGGHIAISVEDFTFHYESLDYTSRKYR